MNKDMDNAFQQFQDIFGGKVDDNKKNYVCQGCGTLNPKYAHYCRFCGEKISLVDDNESQITEDITNGGKTKIAIEKSNKLEKNVIGWILGIAWLVLSFVICTECGIQNKYILMGICGGGAAGIIKEVTN